MKISSSFDVLRSRLQTVLIIVPETLRFHWIAHHNALAPIFSTNRMGFVSGVVGD